MTWYLSIQALGELIDLGLDESARAMCAFSILARKRPSDTFVRELIAILEAAGVGTEGTTIFASTKAVIPPTGTVLSIKATGGAAPEGTVEDSAAYRRPAAQIIVRSPTWHAAEAMAQAAYSALTSARNRHVELET